MIDPLSEQPISAVASTIDVGQEEFAGKPLVATAGETGTIRGPDGVELKVMLPVVNAPFRVYFAYNPSTIRENLQPPIVADRAAFPNAATFNNAVASFGQIYPFDDRRTYFHFTVGRTF